MKKLIAALAMSLSLAACSSLPAPTPTYAYTFKSVTATQEQAEKDAWWCDNHVRSKSAAKCMTRKGYELVKAEELPFNY